MLELQGVVKDYGRRRVLRGIDLRVDEGQRVAIGGPNGSGKSTLLQVAATVVRPTAGTVRIGQLDAARHGADARRLLGWLPQDPALYPDLTPIEHLRWARRLHGRGDWQQAAKEAGLGDAAHRPCRNLSGGQRQRTALALATLHRPPLLLLDEPQRALDAAGLDWLDTLLESQDGAVVVATHTPHRALQRTLELP